jgi:hypothetical protein
MEKKNYNKCLYTTLENFGQNRGMFKLEKTNDQEWRFVMIGDVELVIKSFWENLVISVKTGEKFISLTCKSEKDEVCEILDKIINLENKMGVKFSSDILLLFSSIKN